MSLLASVHAAFETVSKIAVTDFVKGSDDLLLGEIGDFHFVLRGHARIYVALSDEPSILGMWSVE